MAGGGAGKTEAGGRLERWRRPERAEARRKNNTAGGKTQQEDDFEETYLHMLAGHEWAEHEDDMMRKNTTERLAWQTETTARHEEKRK